jgi:hypothetical protein
MQTSFVREIETSDIVVRIAIEMTSWNTNNVARDKEPLRFIASKLKMAR